MKAKPTRKIWRRHRVASGAQTWLLHLWQQNKGTRNFWLPYCGDVSTNASWVYIISEC